MAVHGYPGWPTWRDGKPVKPGETAMSLAGPMKIDEVAVGISGWRLWSNQSMYDGAEKWLYIIDEGDWFDHPTREDEECDFWSMSDPIMPCMVFAPKKLYEEG